VVFGDEERPLAEEYHFDYVKARPNRFAGAFAAEHLLVALDPDVAAVFKTSEQVNCALRDLIQTMPTPS